MNLNNLAQKTNYIAGSDKLSISNLYLQAVNIPGLTFQHPAVSGRSGTQLNLTGDVITFADLSFDVLLDENFLVYDELTTKMFNNVSPTSGSFASQEFDFWIEIQNTKGHKLFKMEFNSCRLSSIGDIELTSTSDETEILMNLTVTYDYFNVVRNRTLPVMRT